MRKSNRFVFLALAMLALAVFALAASASWAGPGI
jgi:hypothetical protein